MSYEEFIQRVAARDGFRDRAQAELATQAALRALAARLDEARAAPIARRLPRPLARHVRRAASSESAELELEQLLTWLAEQPQGAEDREEACRRVRAVFATLREVLPARGYMRAVERLPREYAEVTA